MTRTNWAYVRVSVYRSERFEYRLAQCESLLRSPYHETIAIFQAPDTAASTSIDEIDAMLLQLCATPHTVMKVGVPTVNYYVAFGEIFSKHLDRIVNRLASRDHYPNNARGGKTRRQVGQISRPDSSEPHSLFDSVQTTVVYNQSVSPFYKALRHIAAHAAESNHGELHVYL
jgi:hypothetical protein